MARPWEAEHDVDRERARRLVAARFEDLADVEPEPCGVGWDNTAWRFGEWVFRFPRRAIAVPLLETENRVLPAIAARLPLAIPVPERLGAPGPELPWPFAGYRRLPGRTACVARSDDAERPRAAPRLAKFLRALHAIDAGAARALGAGPDTLQRMERAKRRDLGLERLAELERRGVDVDGSRIRAALEALPAGYRPRATALVHGDLYVRHLIVDDANELTGVIDWGDLHVGDPAIDLAVLASWVPPEARAAFEQAYGPIDDTTRLALRFRAAFHTVTLLLYALDAGAAELEREAALGLARL